MTRITRLLVPTDFSATSDIALTYAIDLAVRFGASIRLLHVVDETRFASTHPDGYFADSPTLRAQMFKDAQDRLTKAAAQCSDAHVKSTWHVMTGRPEAAITAEAFDRGSDLIVMGTHGRSGVAHLFVGSVAERVVRTSPCPVLTVRDTARVVDAIVADSVRPELEALKA